MSRLIRICTIYKYFPIFKKIKSPTVWMDWSECDFMANWLIWMCEWEIPYQIYRVEWVNQLCSRSSYCCQHGAAGWEKGPYDVWDRCSRRAASLWIHAVWGSRLLKPFIYLWFRLKQADWLILSIFSESTNQHAWVWVFGEKIYNLASRSGPTLLTIQFAK